MRALNRFRYAVDWGFLGFTLAVGVTVFVLCDLAWERAL